MKNLEKFIKENQSKTTSSKAEIFDLSKETDKKNLEDLVEMGKIQYVVEDYEEQQKEYFQVMNPALVYNPKFKEEFEEYFGNLQKEKPLWQHGKWVYYPWISTIVHILEEDAFQLVRTARNKNLITREEQEKFYNATIGIAGLSVGNSVALAIVLQGGGKHIKLADHDRLALSNTNRIRTGVDNLGVLKVEMTARQIYLINPYIKVELFTEGLTKENIDNFFQGLSIVVDELDNIAVKYLIREHAKKNKIAVVMGADNGDNAIIDIERYDINYSQEFFHARLGETNYEKLSSLDKFGIGRTIAQHLGLENVTERTLRSLSEMGKTLVSWPQLGGAALINGSAIAYCVRKILNNQSIESNRALISLDEKLIPEYNTSLEKEKREKITQEFKKMFGL